MASNPNNLAFDAANVVGSAYSSLTSSVGRLASGNRIVTAADDAAGLAVRELLRADVAAVRQGQRNVTDGISMIQTAEGAAGVVNSNLVRMKELATQAASPTYSIAQKKIMQKEFDHLAAENARIASDTTFNGTSLFADGGQINISLGGGSQIGFATQTVDMPTVDLLENPLAAASAVDAAINQTSSYRGSLGSTMRRLGSAYEVLSVTAENLLASESRISDADVAVKVAGMTSRQVRKQVAIASEVHAGAIAQVMQLLIG